VQFVLAQDKFVDCVSYFWELLEDSEHLQDWFFFCWWKVNVPAGRRNSGDLKFISIDLFMVNSPREILPSQDFALLLPSRSGNTRPLSFQRASIGHVCANTNCVAGSRMFTEHQQHESQLTKGVPRKPSARRR
jgi:hypothetical protein